VDLGSELDRFLGQLFPKQTLCVLVELQEEEKKCRKAAGETICTQYPKRPVTAVVVWGALRLGVNEEGGGQQVGREKKTRSGLRGLDSKGETAVFKCVGRKAQQPGHGLPLTSPRHEHPACAYGTQHAVRMPDQLRPGLCFPGMIWLRCRYLAHLSRVESSLGLFLACRQTCASQPFHVFHVFDFTDGFDLDRSLAQTKLQRPGPAQDCTLH
jgi:hypothetical protein